MASWFPAGQSGKRRIRETDGGADAPAHQPGRRRLRDRPGARRRGRLVDPADRAGHGTRGAPLRRAPAGAGRVPQGADRAAAAAGRRGGALPGALPGPAAPVRVPAHRARTRTAARADRAPGLGRHLGAGGRGDDGDDRGGIEGGDPGARAGGHPPARAAAAGPRRRAARPGRRHPVHRPVLLSRRLRPPGRLPAGLVRDPGRERLHARILHLPGPVGRVRRGGRDRARGLHPAPGRAAGLRGRGAAAVPAAVRRGAGADGGAAPAHLPRGRHQPAEAADAGGGPRPDSPRGAVPDHRHRGERPGRPRGGTERGPPGA